MCRDAAADATSPSLASPASTLSSSRRGKRGREGRELYVGGADDDEAKQGVQGLSPVSIIILVFFLLSFFACGGGFVILWP